MLTALDGAYKVDRSGSAHGAGTFAAMTGNPWNRRARTAVPLNYLDILRPKFFVARVAHRAAKMLLKHRPG